MKKKWLAALAALFAIAFAGCKVISESGSVAVESVKLSETTLTLAPSATKKLTATVTLDNADDKTVKWSSSAADIVMVGSDGTVAALKEGTATITARAGGKTATCAVTVNEAAVGSESVAVESVTLNATTLTIEPSKTRKLVATVTPSNADDKTVAWSSSDTEVAIVGNDGTVVAIKTGTTTITAQAGGKTATCAVTVKLLLVAVDGVTLDKEMLTLTRGETDRLTATVTPSNADDTSVAWSSSDASVAMVDSDGVVTAVAEGSATITAQAGDKTAICRVTVNEVDVNPDPVAVENITLSETTLTLMPGGTKWLTAEVTPSNADDTSVAWSSSDASVAMVDSDGTVTAVKEGTATITARAGSKAAVCTVSVLNEFVIEDGVLIKYKGIRPMVDIPANVTQIGSGAFERCMSLTTLNIPIGVTSIEDDAFKCCANLTTVNIPATVTKIASSAFYECKNIKTVNYSGTLTQWCSMQCDSNLTENANSVKLGDGKDLKTLKELEIPKGVQYIGDCAFWMCECLTNVTISSDVKVIGQSAFGACKALESVVIPDSVTSIGLGAFAFCKALKSVTIPDSVTSIGDIAFEFCESLTDVTIPGSMKSIGEIAFGSCYSLKNVTILNGVESIRWGAFTNCSKLAKITIPASVKSIERAVFLDCYKSIVVYYGGTKSQWDAALASNANLPSEATVYYNATNGL